jgi:hypothetical protein
MASRSAVSTNLIRFGDDFELDPRAYELRRSGQALKLERIPMELLLLLVEQRGQLVSREQIVERIWGKDVFLDTDNKRALRPRSIIPTSVRSMSSASMTGNHSSSCSCWRGKRSANGLSLSPLFPS